MITKKSIEIPELFGDQNKIQKMEMERVIDVEGGHNLSAKAEMAKELYVIGLSNEAIGRVLHIPEDALDSILKKSQ